MESIYSLREHLCGLEHFACYFAETGPEIKGTK